jgi:hypothetical protein
MSSKKRKSISLQKKYDILKDVEKDIDYGVIVQKYELKGKSNISSIVSNKDKIISAFESGQHKTSRKKLRESKYEEVDDAVLKWFTIARESKISLSGHLIKAQALEFAEKLGYSGFKASEGWLTRFKERHNIVYRAVSGESASVNQTIVNDWVQNQLPELIKGKG